MSVTSQFLAVPFGAGQPGPIRAEKMSVGPFLACGAAGVKIA